jgi:SAM-dependent MidA family methyltransferase
VLRQPGTRDITHHVDWTAVQIWLRREGLEVTGPIPQRDMLTRLGLRELDAESRSLYSRATQRGDGRTALRALARRTAAGALTDRGGLGALDVVVGLRDIPAPSVLEDGPR